MGDFDMSVTQTDAQDEADNMYISLATAVTINKCKAVQKREKLKLMIENIKKLNENLKLAKEEGERVKREKDDVEQQKAQRVLSLTGDEHSCTSLEKMLCDLNSKLIWEQAETQRKSDEYKAAMLDSLDIWKSYEKSYKELPKARKLKEVTVEMKKADIELKRTLLDINDMKFKIELREEIRAKKLHNWGVELAKAYFKLQEKIAKGNAIKEEIKARRNLIEDMKVGNDRSQQTVTQNTPRTVNTQETQMSNPLKTLQFEIPHLLVTSSPPTVGQSKLNATSERKKFCLDNLLQSYGVFSKTIQNATKKTTGYSSESNIVTRAVIGNKPKSNTESITYISNDNSEANKTPMKLSLQINNALPSIKKTTPDQSKDKLKVTFDRKQIMAENQNTIHNEPAEKIMIVDAVPDISVPVNLADYNKLISDNVNQIEQVIEKNISNEILLQKKNITHPDQSLQSLSGTKKYMLSSVADCNRTSFVYESQNTTQNVTSILSDEQLGIPPAQNAQSTSREDGILETPSVAPQPSPKIIEGYQSNLQHSRPIEITEIDMFANEETESQPDFTSPIELNEAANLAYQRLVKESPVFSYPRGPVLMGLNTSGKQVSASVRSQYFSKNTSLPSKSHSTSSQDNYQPTQFSPPIKANSSIIYSSPPLGNSDGFNLERGAPRNLFDPNLQNPKSPEEGFNFMFNTGPPKSSSNSIFNLF